MHRSVKYTILSALLLTMGLAVAAIAADTPRRSGPMMGDGGMMGRKGQMMDHCSQMMGGGSTRPNEKWKEPSTPDKGTPEKKS
jgi:Spy/CpxP family protein refolding chaperone